MIASERHWIMEAALLNQLIYFKDVLTSKWESKDMLLWEGGYTFLPTGNKRLCICSGLKIRFDQERLPLPQKF